MPTIRCYTTERQISWRWSWKPLEDLFEHARRGHRIWELFQILRPVDLTRYLQANEYRDDSKGSDEKTFGNVSDSRELTVPHLGQYVPREIYHQLESVITAPDMEREMLRQWDRVLSLQAFLKDSDDPLIQYELEAIESGWTKYDRVVWATGGSVPMAECDELKPIASLSGRTFQSIVKELVKLKEISSVSILGIDDFELIQILSREWLARKQRGGTFEGYSAYGASWCRRDCDTYDSEEGGMPFIIPNQPIWSEWITFSNEGVEWAEFEINLLKPYREDQFLRRTLAKVVLSESPWEYGTLPRNVIWHKQTEEYFVAVTDRGKELLNRVQAIVAQYS